jgi:GTP-binding protein EngB required for normal cell division
MTFVDGHSEEIPLNEIGHFVTEQGNPGNTRNVIRAMAEIPSPKLTEGIVLVDTPGLGSLAKRGARETLAYLPSADLGVLLVDAGTTLCEEDIGTLRLLNEAGIPSLVLLSKADLLHPNDLESALAYIGEQLEKELGIHFIVHPVSALPSHSASLDDFYQSDLLPRFACATSLRNESAGRKIAALRDAVIAAIETTLDRSPLVGDQNQSRLDELEARLRHSIGVIGERRRVLEYDLLLIEESCDRALSYVAEAGMRWSRSTGQTAIPPGHISEWIGDFVEEQLQQPIRRLRETSEEAIHVMQQIAATLHAPDAPAMSEIELLLRDLPRFELAELTTSISAGHWILLGEKMAISRVRSRLKEELESILRERFRAYGRVLHRWMERTTRGLERLVSSYADGYRVQIHRLAGRADESPDIEQLRQDLTLLLRSGQDAERQNSSQTA